MAEHIMSKSTLHVVDLLHQHDPNASDEQIAEVISEWGHLLDERSAPEDESANAEDQAAS
jgi:hypothetical protein